MSSGGGGRGAGRKHVLPPFDVFLIVEGHRSDLLPQFKQEAEAKTLKRFNRGHVDLEGEGEDWPSFEEAQSRLPYSASQAVTLAVLTLDTEGEQAAKDVLAEAGLDEDLIASLVIGWIALRRKRRRGAKSRSRTIIKIDESTSIEMPPGLVKAASELAAKEIRERTGKPFTAGRARKIWLDEYIRFYVDLGSREPDPQ